MDHQKWIARSLTAWGVVIMLLTNFRPLLGSLFGFDLEVGDIQDLNNSGSAFITAAGNMVGAVMAIWGRVRASTKATVLPTKKT